MSDILCKVHLAAVRRALICAAEKDIRYYLNGVRIRPNPDGGVFVEGCNGHVYIAAKDQCGKATATVLVTRSVLARAPLGMQGHLVVYADGTCRVENVSLEPLWVSPRKVDTSIAGMFPDVLGIYAPAKFTRRGLSNACAMRLLSKLLCASGKNQPIAFYEPEGTENDGAVSFFVCGNGDFGIVMPMRGDLPTPARAVPASFIPQKPAAPAVTP